MIDLREETLVTYDSSSRRLQGLFEVDDQVGYVELENSQGSWKGFVPRSTEIFEFENGKLTAPSGREIPSVDTSRRGYSSGYYVVAAIVILLLIFFLTRWVSK